jgi:hypothetical protein
MTEDPLRTADADGKFNTEHTAKLAALFKVPFTDRNQNWVNEFRQYALNATMVSGEPQIMHGPDGFPYFYLAVPKSGQSVTPFCLVHIIDHCIAQGVGVVMFGSDGNKEPGFVFSYGQLACLKAFGRWELEEAFGKGLETSVVEENREVLTGVPNDTYYPKFMWPHLGRFMKEGLGMDKPKIGILIDRASTPHENLVLNIVAENIGDEQQLQKLARALQWFLLPGQALMFLPGGMNDGWMAPLPTP